MTKCMSKDALPRHHPKHPSQLHLVYETRRELNEKVEKAKTDLRDLYTSDISFRQAVEFRINWSNTNLECLRELRYAQAVHDTVTLPMESFVAYRRMQQSVNQARKLLHAHDAQNSPCCLKHQFTKDVLTFTCILRRNLCHAFRHYVQIENPGDFDLVTPGMRQSACSNETSSVRSGKLLSLFNAITSASSLWDHYDSMQSLLAYFQEYPSDLERFEPHRIAAVVERLLLFTHSFVHCFRVFLPSTQCAKCTRKGSCGLLKPVGSQDYWSDPCFLGVHEGPVRDAIYDTFPTNDDPFTVPARRLRTAVIEHVKERCLAYRKQDPILQELLKILEGSFQRPRQQSPDRSLALVNQKAGISNEPRPDTAADQVSHAKELEEPRESQKPETSQGQEESQESEVPEEPKEPKELEDHVIPVAALTMNVIANVAIEEDGFEEEIVDPRIANEVDPLSARLSTIAKYHARGYGQSNPRPSQSLRKDITKRMWTINDRTEYYDVWRMIFPLTHIDRQIKRVSWPLFQQAMQSAPVSCRIKKAAYPMFVFERRNENDGREIFECHAPHGRDWIPASDLYRYKKDLRDTFGMDADRIVLGSDE